MGEIAINPIHNVHKQYRQMIFANPYRFGIPTPPLPPNNTFIGGVASTINTPTLLAAKLENYPSGTAFSDANIQNFTIVGDDIECYIGVDYQIAINAFRNNLLVTHYYDNLSCKAILGGAFFGDTGNIMNLKNIICKNVLLLGYNAFNQDGGNGLLQIVDFPNCTEVQSPRTFLNQVNLRTCNISKCITIGTNVLYNEVFRQCSSVLKVYAEPSMQTINAGGVEGDLSYVTGTLGGQVIYAANYTAPNPITNLTIGTVYGTALQLNFTAPTGSANAIDFYEVWNGNKYLGKINASGDYVINLTINTTYANLEVKPVDIYYNKSTSNIVSQTTSATYVIPTANIVSNWQMENNVLDSVGSNDGTATAITYTAGLVGQTAVFNGTTSIIKMNGYNTGFNAVDFSVVQLFKTTQTTVFRLLQNRGQGGAGVTKGWQISYIATGNWSNIVIDDGLGNIILMDNIPYNEDDNVWHSLVMTWETLTGTCSVYIDGVFKGLKTNANLINANLNALDVCFGGSNTNGQLFNGQGDEAAILNVLLSAGQVADINAKLNAGQHLI